MTDTHTAQPGTGPATLQTRLRRTLPMAAIEVTELGTVPPIRLALINADFPTGPLPQSVMNDVIAEPAYWAFCWGSGLALAEFLLDDPDRVAGRHVVDLGSGSGIAAIAAALAGAARVDACDVDADARAATAVNARLNGVEIGVRAELPLRCDVILMADVLYDRANLGLLEVAQRHADEILVADTRVTRLPDPAYREIARRAALTRPNLGEFDEFRTAHIFRRSG